MRLLHWMRKDFDDHRPVLIGIFLAIPILTAVAFWGFGVSMRGATPETVGGIFALGLMVLLWFGVASDLVATDVRRGTLSAMRRTPRGLGLAWTGKLCFLTLVVAGLAGWMALCLNVAWSIVASDNGLASEPGSTRDYWMTLAMGAPLLSWPLLIGTWIGRSGAAGLGSVLALGATGAPAWLWWRAHRYVFPAQGHDALRTLALWVGAAGFVLATISFLFGHRHRGRAWRPFLVGGSALLVLCVGGFAWGAWKTHRWTQLEPTDTDLRLYATHAADDGKTLWVSVYRGVPWSGGKPFSGYPEKPGTPLQTWIVDVDKRSVHKIDEGAERHLSRPNEAFGPWHRGGSYTSLDPVQALWTYAFDEDEDTGRVDVRRVTWWDTAARETVATLPIDVRNAATDKLMNRWLRATTPHRDDDGRRVWLREGVFEREGDERTPATGTYRPRMQRPMAAVPGGWFGYDMVRRVSGSSRLHMRVVDRAGDEALYPTHDYSAVVPFVLSTRYWYSYPRGRGRPAAVRAFDAPTVRIPIREAPADHGRVVAENRMLARRGDPEAARLALWNPITGIDDAITWVGDVPERVDGLRVNGRRADGRILVSLYRRVGNMGVQFALLDSKARTVRLVTEVLSTQTRAVAVLADGSVVAVEYEVPDEGTWAGHRVVRLGPAPGQRKVLFPFRE